MAKAQSTDDTDPGEQIPGSRYSATSEDANPALDLALDEPPTIRFPPPRERSLFPSSRPSVFGGWSFGALPEAPTPPDVHLSREQDELFNRALQLMRTGWSPQQQEDPHE